MRVITLLDPKPIPIRGFDWSAVDENYEPGEPIGQGSTEQEAIEGLQRQREAA